MTKLFDRCELCKKLDQVVGYKVSCAMVRLVCKDYSSRTGKRHRDGVIYVREVEQYISAHPWTKQDDSWKGISRNSYDKIVKFMNEYKGS